MDVTSLTGNVMQMRHAEVQGNISMEIMKQKADQMEQMTDMLLQNAREVQVITQNNGSGFSVYA